MASNVYLPLLKLFVLEGLAFYTIYKTESSYTNNVMYCGYFFGDP